jgi:tetratricopeptide (TPR) repeat protein
VLEGEGSDLEIDPELDASLGLEDGSEIELEEDAGPEPTQQVARDDALELSAEEPEADAEASSPDIDPDADVEQLLAEASVFLRYGKHERAVDTLRAALRVEPGNPGALEKLGEALAAMGNRAHASSALARAGAAFADAGDAAGVERVRALLAPLDAKAAAALASPPRAAQAPPPRAAQAAAPADEESGDIDIEIDAGLDEDTLEPAPAEPQAEASPSDDFSGIEIDVSEELREAEREAPGDAEAPKPAADEELLTFETNEVSSPKIAPEAAAPVSADAPAGGADRAEADFEEAEFYREQGMLDEARALYERVIAVSPRHDGARKRLLALSSPAEQGPAPRPEADATLRDARAFESPIAERAEPKRSAGKASAATPVAPAAAEPPLGEAASPGRRPPVAAQATPDEPALELAVETEEPAAGALSEPALGGADFDLAAELSGAFGEAAEGGRGGDAAAGDGFAEVFAAFKAGVKREVGEGDTEAHYDLGIAYKEMGLFEDAIGEFRFALADGARRLACLHLMAACALELGRSRDAVAHLSDALAGGALPPEQEAALRLDLGRAYQASGDAARARSEYEAVRAVAPRFADVDRLLADLAATEASDASEPSDSGEADEAFESFDDLIEPDAPAAPAQSAPGPRYESFSELIADDPEPELESAGDEAPPPPRPKATPPLPPPTAADASPKKPESKSKPAAEGAPPAPPARRKKKISFV